MDMKQDIYMLARHALREVLDDDRAYGKLLLAVQDALDDAQQSDDAHGKQTYARLFLAAMSHYADRAEMHDYRANGYSASDIREKDNRNEYVDFRPVF